MTPPSAAASTRSRAAAHGSSVLNVIGGGACLLQRWRDLLWLRRLDEPEQIVEALRHPSLRDRATLENALSSYFFAPFVHQEVVRGTGLERRARLSRAALSLDEQIVRARSAEATARIGLGEVDDLLDEVRRSVVRATVLVTFGDGALEQVVHAAVADFDRAIKMVGIPDPLPRAALAKRLYERLGGTAPVDTTLGLMQRACSDVSTAEQLDHVASVLLGTGVIQVTDVVTHALIALDQHPEARRASDEQVIAETIRRFPVNASLTRRARRDVMIRGLQVRAGQAITVVPGRMNRCGWSTPDRFEPARHAASGERGSCFGFGYGPRACPARRLAIAMAEVVLAAYRKVGVAVEPGYRHRRSLAVPPQASLGGAACRPRSRQAAVYPRVAWGQCVAPP
jgi:hypothetical protein